MNLLFSYSEIFLFCDYRIYSRDFSCHTNNLIVIYVMCIRKNNLLLCILYETHMSYPIVWYEMSTIQLRYNLIYMILL